MKLNLFYAALLSSALLYLGACGNDAPASPPADQTAPEGEGDHESHAEDGNDHVELTAEEAEAAGIRTGRAQTGAVSGQLELPAEIRFDADRVARVSP
ncbi:efflux RND transporter periplasmic adaptor subunit, partial [Henriciella marina]|nr:efflux RND transporter periplasmic adaptor subunit [Henriciella marina]